MSSYFLIVINNYNNNQYLLSAYYTPGMIQKTLWGNSFTLLKNTTKNLCEGGLL